MESQISIDEANAHSDVKRVKATVARALLAALESECKEYCILSGYDGLPESFETDIDFMVSSDEFERVPRVIAGVADRKSVV